MNIQNINNLANQLKSLGFLNMGYVLAKRICFRPKAFCLPYHFAKGEYTLHFQLSFEKASHSGDYALKFYDAAFQKTTAVEQTIAGFDVEKLSLMMSQIDWKNAFDFSEQKAVAPGDKGAFEKEMIVESIVDRLEALEAAPEGKQIAAHLKAIHWSGSAYHEIFDTPDPRKVKAEVGQRFYIIEGEPGIAVEEAFRYLQNRWLEKEMLAKKKQAETSNDDSDGHGTGLLKKRRRRKTRVAKTEK